VVYVVFISLFFLIFFFFFFFFFQAEDGIRDLIVTGVQTCALPISSAFAHAEHRGLRGEPIRPLRVYALCLAGQVDAARQLAPVVQPQADDERHFWEWLGRTCLKSEEARSLGARLSNASRAPSSRASRGTSCEFRAFFVGGAGLLGACSHFSDTLLE